MCLNSLALCIQVNKNLSFSQEQKGNRSIVFMLMLHQIDEEDSIFLRYIALDL